MYAKLSDTIAGFKRIIAGEFDTIPEKYFMYKAGVDDVVKAYEEEINKLKN